MLDIRIIGVYNVFCINSFGSIPGGSVSLRGNVFIFLLCCKKNNQMYIKSTYRSVNIRNVRDISGEKSEREEEIDYEKNKTSY